MSSAPRIIQIAVLGDGGVGKTAMLRRFKGLPFQARYKMTIGADFVIKRLKYNNQDLTLQIYDVGGQPKFSYLRAQYYNRAEAVVVVFDLLNRATYESIPNWLDEILEKNNYRFLPLLLVGNKEDLKSDQSPEVSAEEIAEYTKVLENWGKSYSDEFEVIYRETSAKTNHNIEDGFLSLIDIVLDES